MKKKTDAKRTLATSESTLLKGLQSRTSRVPLIVEGVDHGTLSTFQPTDFTRFGVDERYQRVRITTAVNDLIHVIKGGGAIVDPITVVERRDGSLWIVDGQQRFWAHDECKVPLTALVYRIDDFENEKRLFLVMNKRVTVNAETIVKAWGGASAAMIREWADKPGSPYRGQVNFGNNSHAPYAATILVRGLLAVSAGIIPVGSIISTLTRCDYALREVPSAPQRAEAYLRLVPLVFPPQARLRYLPGIALGRVAARRWTPTVNGQFPGPTTYERLKRVNWDVLVPSPAMRFLSLIEGEIEKRWKA